MKKMEMNHLNAVEDL